jgi:L-lactate dehydrogenase complex protein LldF
VITPHLRGLHDWKHLSAASSLCGACTEACPVKIDLHHHLLHNRRNAASSEPSIWERWGYRIFAWMVTRPSWYQLAKELARWTEPLQRLIRGKRIDPARAWTATRDLPPMPRQSFKEWWQTRP